MLYFEVQSQRRTCSHHQSTFCSKSDPPQNGEGFFSQWSPWWICCWILHEQVAFHLHNVTFEDLHLCNSVRDSGAAPNFSVWNGQSLALRPRRKVTLLRFFKNFEGILMRQNINVADRIWLQKWNIFYLSESGNWLLQVQERFWQWKMFHFCNPFRPIVAWQPLIMLSSLTCRWSSGWRRCRRACRGRGRRRPAWSRAWSSAAWTALRTTRGHLKSKCLLDFNDPTTKKQDSSVVNANSLVRSLSDGLHSYQHFTRQMRVWTWRVFPAPWHCRV